MWIIMLLRELKVFFFFDNIVSFKLKMYILEYPPPHSKQISNGGTVAVPYLAVLVYKTTAVTVVVIDSL